MAERKMGGSLQINENGRITQTWTDNLFFLREQSVWISSIDGANIGWKRSKWLFGLFVTSAILLIGELYILYGDSTLSISEELKFLRSTDWLAAFAIFTVIFLVFFYFRKRWLLRIYAGNVVLEEQVKKRYQDAVEFIRKLEKARDQYTKLSTLSGDENNK